MNNGIYENIDITDILVNTNLKNEIEELDKIYQSTFNENYPPEPYKLTRNLDLLFTNRVLQSYEILKKELLDNCVLEFNSLYWLQRLSHLKDNDTI